MSIYSQFINFAKLASNMVSSFFSKNMVPTGSSVKKLRTGSKHGMYTNKIAKRRRLNELAKRSRRINWQVTKGVAIRG